MAEILTNLGIKDIKKYLCNRYPYLMIDYIEEINPGISVRAYKNITANEWFFPVHFPEEPMMPGMIQMEALLQALSLCVLVLPENRGKTITGKNADKIRLRRRVEPGSRMYIEAEIECYENNIASGRARGIIANEEVCSGEFTFTLEED